VNLKYDLKSYLKRTSVIISVIIFIIIGITSLSLTYFMYSANLQPYHYVFLTYSHYDEENIGYMVNFYGEPIPNAKIITNKGVFTSNVSGFFYFNGTINNVKINGNNVRFISNKYFIIVNTTDNRATLIVLAFPKTKIYFGYSLTDLIYKGEMKNFENKYVISYSPSYVLSYVKLNSTVFTFSISYKTITPSSFSLKATQLLIPIYPLLIIYIIFIVLVTQKSNRSIETILSSPITKIQLLFSRYVVGIIPLIISSLVTSLLILIVTELATSYFDLIPIFIKSFTLLLSTLISIYSLYFLTGVVSRNSGNYILSSITIFTVFFIILVNSNSLPNFFNYIDPLIIEFSYYKLLSITLWFLIPLIFSIFYFDKKTDI